MRAVADGEVSCADAKRSVILIRTSSLKPTLHGFGRIRGFELKHSLVEAGACWWTTLINFSNNRKCGGRIRRSAPNAGNHKPAADYEEAQEAFWQKCQRLKLSAKSEK